MAPSVAERPHTPVAEATPEPQPQAQHRLLLAVIAIGTTALAIVGWKLFWFLTDDAYIAFRYISNSLAGRGLVWNPAPFRPVEGYTSFLWVVLLREVWRITGIEPPQSANVISLLFGLGSLFLGACFVMRMSLPARIERYRVGLLALALLGAVTNRTFLAWLSSGLETALFNFLFTWWVYVGTAREGRSRSSWTFQLASSAALCELCRPDGLLIVAATAFILLVEQPRSLTRLYAASPLLLVPAHVLWRRSFYGDWLPNTYRAKYEGAWPESGIRYLASFVLEYGVWWWALLLIAWIVRNRRVAGPWRWNRIAPLIPIAVVAAHLAYYTFIIGGDHFEYRVYSHLIVLLMVSAAWLASEVAPSGAAAAGLVAGFILVSYPIPWTHWWMTKDMNVRERGKPLLVHIADQFPWPARPVVALWDDWQTWLIEHLVGMRHQEHKVFEQRQIDLFPTREEGSKIAWDERNVRADGTVGVAGWVLPNVAIIDRRGLNDRVIAGHRPPEFEKRGMAHDRAPPPGYEECFRPNVFIDHRRVWLKPREAPLTDEDIRRCESRDWERTGG
jgi:arabinofuranosyltransferase